VCRRLLLDEAVVPAHQTFLQVGQRHVARRPVLFLLFVVVILDILIETVFFLYKVII
jgi:hypothetical protein